MINTRVRPAVTSDAPQMATLFNSIIAPRGTTFHQIPMTANRIQNYYIKPEGMICVQVAITNGRLSEFQFLGLQISPHDQMPNSWAIIASFVAPNLSQMGIGQNSSLPHGELQLLLVSNN